MSRAPGTRRRLPEARAVFAVPGDLDTPTGGYAYDRRIAAELRTAGWALQWLRLPDGFPHPSAAALSSAYAQLARQQQGTALLIDGLALGAMPDVSKVLGPRRPLVALVHHPLALETGLDPGRAAQLRASERAALAAARRVVATSRATARVLAADYGVPRLADHGRAAGDRSGRRRDRQRRAGPCDPERRHAGAAQGARPADGRAGALARAALAADGRRRRDARPGDRAGAARFGAGRRPRRPRRIRRRGRRAAAGRALRGRRPLRARLALRGLRHGLRRGARPRAAGRRHDRRRDSRGGAAGCWPPGAARRRRRARGGAARAARTTATRACAVPTRRARAASGLVRWTDAARRVAEALREAA